MTASGLKKTNEPTEQETEWTRLIKLVVRGFESSYQQQSEEDDGADDEQDLELSKRRQSPDLFSDRKSGFREKNLFWFQTLFSL